MLKPKAVAAYLPEHSIVADELWNHVMALRNQEKEVDDLRPILDRYAAECKSFTMKIKMTINEHLEHNYNSVNCFELNIEVFCFGCYRCRRRVLQQASWRL